MFRKINNQWVQIGGASQYSPPAGVRAYSTAATSVPASTWTPLAFQAEDYDTNGFHDNVTNNTRFTVPAGQGGRYALLATAYAQTTAAGEVDIGLRKNGTTWLEVERSASTLAGQALRTSTLVNLLPGDYVEVSIYQNTAGAINFGDANGYNQNFSMTRLDGVAAVADGVGQSRAVLAHSTAAALAVPHATYTAIPFATEEHDSLGAWGIAAPTRFIAPITGLYSMIGQTEWAPTPDGFTRRLLVAKNGDPTNGLGEQQRETNANSSLQQVAALARLNAGDYVELYAYQNTGQSVKLSEHYSDRVIADNPAGYWRLNDTTAADGTVAARSAGAGTLTYRGTILANEAGYSSSEKAVHLDSNDDYAAIQGVPDSVLHGTHAVEFWIQETTRVAGDNPILGAGTSLINEGLHLTIRDGKLHQGFYGNDLTDTAILVTGQWYHVVMVYNGSEQRIYRDGALVATKATATGYTGISSDLALGRAYGTDGTAGTPRIRTSDLALYDRALTDAEIAAHYELATSSAADASTRFVMTLLEPQAHTHTNLDSVVTKSVQAGLDGATAANRYVGATTTGAPTTGTFAVGDWVMSHEGSVWVCMVAGTPGTWRQISGGAQYGGRYALPDSVIDFSDGLIPAGFTQSGGTYVVTKDYAPPDYTRSLQSPIIGHGATTYIERSITVEVTSTYSFWINVSTEANYDFVRFLVNAVEQSSWSGSVGWTQVFYTLAPGTHTLRWSYTKDGSVSEGLDVFFITGLGVVPAKQYAVGDLVTYRGKLYEASVAVDSASGIAANAPGTLAAWKQIAVDAGHVREAIAAASKPASTNTTSSPFVNFDATDFDVTSGGSTRASVGFAPVIDFPDGVTSYATLRITRDKFPKAWFDDTLAFISILEFTNATANTGNVRLMVDILTVAQNGSVVGTSAQSLVTSAMPAQNVIKSYSLGNIGPSSLTHSAYIRVGRIGADAADTFIGAVSLTGLYFEKDVALSI